jgi:hypothetical protein
VYGLWHRLTGLFDKKTSVDYTLYTFALQCGVIAVPYGYSKR